MWLLCGYIGNLDIVDESMNSKTRILLEYQGFLGDNVEEAWYLLQWIAWDSFEFEKGSRVFIYSFPYPSTFYSRSYYAPFAVICIVLLNMKLICVLYYACYTQPSFVLPWDTLDQCTGLEVDEPFRIVAKFSIADASFETEDTFDKVHDPIGTPSEGSHEVFVHYLSLIHI